MNLAGEVTVLEGTRQNRLVEACANDSVCGIYFPALQGFGSKYSRAFISYLPEYLSLSGLEVIAAIIGYPAIFGRDSNTPDMRLSSLEFRDRAILSFCTKGLRRKPGFYGEFDYGSGCDGSTYSSGLSILG